ncbi:hypothetical protein RRG08_015158 [Elysia crispata]|uniref:Uncharacterized protein n=1 Tax=Elysia crispata TaxID=231223 RepID=A0AAE1AZU5_9GAST|nr:hypothetical protein RRG08_015158 [Elysia crispata]
MTRKLGDKKVLPNPKAAAAQKLDTCHRESAPEGKEQNARRMDISPGWTRQTLSCSPPPSLWLQARAMTAQGPPSLTRGGRKTARSRDESLQLSTCGLLRARPSPCWDFVELILLSLKNK